MRGPVAAHPARGPGPPPCMPGPSWPPPGAPAAWASCAASGSGPPAARAPSTPPPSRSPRCGGPGGAQRGAPGVSRGVAVSRGAPSTSPRYQGKKGKARTGAGRGAPGGGPEGPGGVLLLQGPLLVRARAGAAAGRRLRPAAPAELPRERGRGPNPALRRAEPPFAVPHRRATDRRGPTPPPPAPKAGRAFAAAPPRRPPLGGTPGPPGRARGGPPRPPRRGLGGLNWEFSSPVAKPPSLEGLADPSKTL